MKNQSVWLFCCFLLFVSACNNRQEKAGENLPDVKKVTLEEINPDLFSEYGSEQWSLAPTAFAAKFIGRALWLLSKNDTQIDEDVFERSRIAMRKTLFIGFTHEGLWEHGRNYTNQYVNLWGGALMYLDVWPDPEIIKSFLNKLFQFESQDLDFGVYKILHYKKG